MASGNVLFFDGPDPFPKAEVLDLAVSVAIGNELAANEDEMASQIADWFLRPATRSELLASVARLIDRGWIDRCGDSEFDLCLTDTGVDATTTLSGGMIRMIDRGRGLLKTSYLLQMLDLEKGKCP